MTNLPANVHTQAWLSMTTEPTRLAAGHSAQCSVGRTTADSDSVRTAAAPMGSTATCNTASDTALHQDPRLPSKIPIWKTVAELLQWWENGSGARTEGTQSFLPMRSWTASMLDSHRSTFKEDKDKRRFNKDLHSSALDYLIISQMVTERQRGGASRVEAVDVLNKEKIAKAKLRKESNPKEKGVIGRARIAAAQNANAPSPLS